jgi:phage terminase large subunit
LTLASPNLRAVPARLTLDQKREYLALIERKQELVRDRRARERVEEAAGGWKVERQRCAADIMHWFNTWLFTYDPRLIGTPTGPYLQFKLWPKQRDIVEFIEGRIAAQKEGLIEKSRDVGVSYLCAAVALHKWLFIPGFKATFGSRVEDDVDKKDNPDSIFTKLRLMARRLPPEMMPAGFRWNQHDNFMRFVNPDIGAIITGEGGENMGRGGRSTVYFLDEAARVPNADKVEAALAGNTDCVIWVSSVNGMGNLFARKRHSILKPHQIARLHWRDEATLLRTARAYERASQWALTNPKPFDA